ncbi:uncharacterized protein F5147DRAFT_642453 [Suillus discolor]|uniref:Uncharacterized protein n=1 Tax=Suillus discolor TaxID=1912936 RepID=A0A9P7JP57_9AGAM|nr:uncharacterized protein F5147DRAFT_642453 [Suillus discolor]KAG2093908.1 hypothetical protein F5147DRAFT_642453 [Suillus discolor]
MLGWHTDHGQKDVFTGTSRVQSIVYVMTLILILILLSLFYGTSLDSEGTMKFSRNGLVTAER